jgi:ATP-dependent exoDNAse (exonuclease V) beta subunit
LTAAGSLTPDNLAEQAAQLFAPADPAGGGVQMMTIHKSKGLEFDTVIVPGLHRETGANDSPLLLWDNVLGPDGTEGLLVAPMRQKGVAADGPSAYNYLKRLEAERGSHEDERLLYVAATRAIRRLHLVGCARPDEKKDDGLKPPASGTLLKLLWHGVAQPVFADGLAAIATKADQTEPGVRDSATFVPPLLRVPKVEVPAPLRALPDGENLPANPVTTLDANETTLSLEASVGTLVHRYLELIARQGVAAWSAERLAGQRAAMQRWLESRGHGAEDSAAGADEVANALKTTLNSDTGRWLLADHPEAAAEAAWTSADGDATAHHVIDRTFVADGVRWIVDYKTVRAAEADLPQRAEGFRPQLERYAALFVGDALPLRLAIYFTLQGKLVELAR